MLSPLCPKAGPIGGEGLALPAGTCNFIYPTIFLAIYPQQNQMNAKIKPNKCKLDSRFYHTQRNFASGMTAIFIITAGRILRETLKSLQGRAKN
jgi:hypothetical protein